jgi:aminopeptidase-like protein
VSDGDTLFDLVRQLYPIPRSLTGDGVRATLEAIAAQVPLDVVEVPTGTPVLDWTVPQEWVFHEAWVEDLAGRRVIDAADHGLTVMGYSTPVDEVVDRDELLAHLHTLPDQPDRIPYRTSYYAEAWGLCTTQRLVDSLTDERYRVRIDAARVDGSLTYGEAVLPGATADEVVLTTHICHPMLANDNASGMAVLAGLGRWLAATPRRLTYRLLFLPGTIGSITWLAGHRDGLGAIRAGLTIAGLGDGGGHTYKRTEQEDAWIDRAVRVALRDLGDKASERPFSPWGYDERQFNAPGFRLPFGLLMRTPNGEYPEYHTSADDLGFVQPAQLAGSLAALQAIVEILEADVRWRNREPFGEPQLGRRGLFSAVGGRHAGIDQMARLWVLNQSDGEHGLLDIAERSGLSFAVIRQAADDLAGAGLLVPVDGDPTHPSR